MIAENRLLCNSWICCRALQRFVRGYVKISGYMVECFARRHHPRVKLSATTSTGRQRIVMEMNWSAVYEYTSAMLELDNAKRREERGSLL